MIDYKKEYLKLLRESLTDYKPYDFDEFILEREEGQLSKCKKVPYSTIERFYGKDWPLHGVTMIGLVRLLNLDELVRDIAKNKVEGDFLEAGVWRGGASIYLNALNRAYCNSEKNIWVADSFEGLPPPKHAKDSGYDFTGYKELSVSIEKVKANFKKYELLTENVKFLKGWFKDTLPVAPVEKIAILRLDGDLYESTMDVLNNLYDKVVVGGYVIIDDYFLDCCKEAISDFRAAHNVTDEIIEIDWTGVYWKKS